jgi:hypothetical protein
MGAAAETNVSNFLSPSFKWTRFLAACFHGQTFRWIRNYFLGIFFEGSARGVRFHLRTMPKRYTAPRWFQLLGHYF